MLKRNSQADHKIFSPNSFGNIFGHHTKLSELLEASPSQPINGMSLTSSANDILLEASEEAHDKISNETHSVVLSDEGLFDYRDIHKLSNFVSMLKEIYKAETLKVIIYLRRQPLVALGLYSTSVFQGSRTPSFQEYVSNLAVLEILDYEKLYQTWAGVKSCNEVCLYSWHKIKDTASHFMNEILGCSPLADKSSLANLNFHNKTPDVTSIALARLIINSYSDKFLLKYGREIGSSLYHSLLSKQSKRFVSSISPFAEALDRKIPKQCLADLAILSKNNNFIPLSNGSDNLLTRCSAKERELFHEIYRYTSQPNSEFNQLDQLAHILTSTIDNLIANI